MPRQPKTTPMASWARPAIAHFRWVALKASTLAGYQSANSWCVMCHSLDYVNTQPPMSAAFWSAEVTKMVKVYGAPIPEDQVKLISEYLGKTYGTDQK